MIYALGIAVGSPDRTHRLLIGLLIGSAPVQGQFMRIKIVCYFCLCADMTAESQGKIKKSSITLKKEAFQDSEHMEWT